MAVTPLEDDSYPEPLLSRPAGGAGLWRVLLLAVFFIAVAVAFTLYGDRVPGDLVLLFLGFLGVVGVFSMFALAAGLFRFAGAEESRTLSRAVVDSLPYGALVSERDGRILYANAEYGGFAGGMHDGVPVSVPRLFASRSEASEAMYRLTRAARDGRGAVEDVRLMQPIGTHKGTEGRANWYRIRVQAVAARRGQQQAAGAVVARGHLARPGGPGEHLSASCSWRSTISIMRRPGSSLPTRMGRSSTSTPPWPTGSAMIWRRSKARRCSWAMSFAATAPAC